MPVGSGELTAVAVRHAVPRAPSQPDISIDPSPDWCDGDSPPHVVGDVAPSTPETEEVPTQPHPVPQRAAGLPLPAAVFLALLVAGCAAGFAIGSFGGR